MAQTKWDIYYWMKAEREFKDRVPTKAEVYKRYEQFHYDKEIIETGISMYIKLTSE